MGISYAPNDEPYIVIDDEGKAGCPHVRRIPSYSTDIAAAWGVVEKLGMATIENASRTGPWNVGFVWHSSNGNPYWVHAEAPTCSLAICLAALKAVGVEVEG